MSFKFKPNKWELLLSTSDIKKRQILLYRYEVDWWGVEYMLTLKKSRYYILLNELFEKWSSWSQYMWNFDLNKLNDDTTTPVLTSYQTTTIWTEYSSSIWGARVPFNIWAFDNLYQLYKMSCNNCRTIYYCNKMRWHSEHMIRNKRSFNNQFA